MGQVFAFFKTFGFPSDRLKEYQQLFPAVEVELEIQSSPRKPSRSKISLQENQVSEEEGETKTLETRKPLPRHCLLSKRVSLLTYLISKQLLFGGRFLKSHFSRKNLRLREIVTLAIYAPLFHL
jgi:hypothetical protein